LKLEPAVEACLPDEIANLQLENKMSLSITLVHAEMEIKAPRFLFESLDFLAARISIARDTREDTQGYAAWGTQVAISDLCEAILYILLSLINGLLPPCALP
jgi:hypothetical protein